MQLHDGVVEEVEAEEAVLVEELAARGREGGLAVLLVAVGVHQGELVDVVKPESVVDLIINQFSH